MLFFLSGIASALRASAWTYELGMDKRIDSAHSVSIVDISEMQCMRVLIDIKCDVRHEYIDIYLIPLLSYLIFARYVWQSDGVP